jgi:hypothetical protein
LDRYTHLFEGDLNEVMERLDVASAYYLPAEKRP